MHSDVNEDIENQRISMNSKKFDFSKNFEEEKIIEENKQEINYQS